MRRWCARGLALAVVVAVVGCSDSRSSPCGGCPSDFVCSADGQCRSPCNLHADCPRGLGCSVGLCVPGVSRGDGAGAGDGAGPGDAASHGDARTPGEESLLGDQSSSGDSAVPGGDETSDGDTIVAGDETPTSTLLSKVGFVTVQGTIGAQVSVTDVGFRPRLVVFWWSGQEVEGYGRGNVGRGIGWSTGPGIGRLVANHQEDGLTADSDTHVRVAEDVCIARLGFGGVSEGLAGMVSFDDAGFTLGIAEAFARAMAVSYLALAGPDITAASVGTFTSPSSTGPQDVEVGFAPDLLLIANGNLSAKGIGKGGSLSIGVANATGSQAFLAAGTVDSDATPDARSAARLGDLAVSNTGYLITERGVFARTLPTGFQVDWNLVDASKEVLYYYLAVAGGRYAIGSLQTGTIDGDKADVAGLDFRPSAAMFFSNGEAEATVEGMRIPDRWSVGAFSSLTDQITHASVHAHETAVSQVSTAVVPGVVYFRLFDTGAASATLELVDIKPDGFTCATRLADTAPRFVWYLAAGAE